MFGFYDCSVNSAHPFAAHGEFVVPWTRIQFGNRAFSGAGPVAWNNLSLDIRSPPTLSPFKNMLKTHLLSSFNFT